MNCRFMLIFIAVFAVLKFQFNVDRIATYDIVLLMILKLVRIILQTTFFIVRFNFIFYLKTPYNVFILMINVFTYMGKS